MSIVECEIKDSKKQLDFYKELCEVKDEKIKELENINDKLSSALESAESKNDKAIEKLYCWGEVINPDFQNEMLLILKDGEVEEK